MGGATAQIAFPLKDEHHETAKETVKKLNLVTENEMRTLYGDNFKRIPEIHHLRAGHVETLKQVVGLWAGDMSMLADLARLPGASNLKERWAGDEGGDSAKLEEVVKLWGGDMADLEGVVEQVGSEVDGEATLKKVVGRVEMSKRAQFEAVGQQGLFLASYPLGSNKGYQAFEQALFDQGERYGLRGGEENDKPVCVHTYLYVMRQLG